MADVVVQVQNSSPIVQVRPNTAVVQVSHGSQSVVQSQPDTTVAQISATPPSVVQVGKQGAPGRDGVDGSSAGGVKIPFAFGDATPKPVYLAQAGQTIFTATIVLQVPFNGIGAALQLGDGGMGDRLMHSDQNDPSYAAEYEANPGYTYAAETEILLAITPGEGCTQGSGYILLEV